MGKVSATSHNYSTRNESIERLKKKKRKKDLEEIRRNALAAKRELKCKPEDFKIPKTKLMKTLNQFASLRTDIEDANQTQGQLISRPISKKDKICPKSLRAEGFLRAGVKGRLLTRPCSSATEEKLKRAVLQNNALGLMQSGHYTHSDVSNEKESSVNNVDFMKKKAREILYLSSDSHSDIDSGVINHVLRSSPVLGGTKSSKKKNAQMRYNENNKSSNNCFDDNQFISKYSSKEEKFRRRLFEDEHSRLRNESAEISQNQQDNFYELRFSPKKSSPENNTFLAKNSNQRSSNDKSTNISHNDRIEPSDSDLIKFYLQTCKIITEKEIKNISWNNIDDPYEVAKASLKITYEQTFAEFLKRQENSQSNTRSHLENHTPASTSSEIMLEPDSAVARMLKKNALFRYSDTLILDKDSDSSSSTSNSSESIKPPTKNIKNNSKRKHTPSSKGFNSEREFPSSVKVNFDPQSVKLELKMNYIHPDKQELVARYLNDVSMNSSQEIDKNIFKCKVSKDFEKESSSSNNNEEFYSVHKNSKHIPAILRKNKITEKTASFEEKNQSSLLNYSNSKEIIDKLKFDTDTFVPEKTPDFTNLGLPEAPKCKYEHINAKSRKPFRIGGPVQHKKANNISQKHLFTITRDIEKNFKPRTFQISPVLQSNVPETGHEFHQHFSQENYQKEDCCMNKMESFGEIQERTNRLTLRSSQNCSEETSDLYSSQEDARNLRSNYYIQPSEPVGSKCISYGGTSCLTYTEVPAPFNFSMNSQCGHDLHSSISFEQKPPFVNKTEYQFIPSSIEYSNEISTMNCVPVPQQSIRQPVKFIAVEGNRIPQRLPIYGSNEKSSCSHVHKESVSNQHYMQTKPCSMYKVPLVPHQKQRIPQTMTSSHLDINDYHQLGRFVPLSIQLPDFGSENNGLPNNSSNFVPSNLSSQSYVTQPKVPVHITNNQRLVRQHRLKEMSSPNYSQVEYQRTMYINNEDGHMKTYYFHPLNQNIQCKK